MGRLRIFRRRHRTAILLGLAATAAFLLPPLHLAQRADGILYDAWSRLVAQPAPADVVLITLEDPAWLTTLADIAHEKQARLLVATIPQPPSPTADRFALGPTDLAVSAVILRRTDWTDGGHIWFVPDADGIVRRDRPVLGDRESIPSLAFRAAQLLELGEGPGAASPPAWTPADAGRAGVRDGAERWLKFFAKGSFAELSPADLLSAPDRVRGRIVIAGGRAPVFETPVGQLPVRNLVAQTLAGYLGGQAISAGPVQTASIWVLAGLLVAAFAAWPRTLLRRRWVLPAGGGARVLGLAGLAFLGGGLWLPPAGPALLVLATGGAMAWRPRRRPRRDHGESSLERARRLRDAGEYEAAWAAYHAVPPTPALLEELYEFAVTLEHDNLVEHAADVYHRIALVDAHFRDVAQRLVASTHAGSAAEPPSPKLRGKTRRVLGRYELLAPIGEGSTGKVMLGRDPTINRLLAIKVIDLRAEYEADELGEAKERFRREVETTGRLNHPNIVTVFDIGETDGLAYIAMEYLKGRHLSDFARPEKLLPPALVLELGALVADALDYAHEQNVVHRDIKPANIMYDSVSGILKITDFGIARLIDVSRTRTGIVLGTPSFMAPEQLEGRNVNGNTDLFALGVSLYELLTGRLPFRGASMTKLMFVIANEPHEPVTSLRPDLPDPLDALFDMALAKDPDNRFRTGAEMAEALRAVTRQLS